MRRIGPALFAAALVACGLADQTGDDTRDVRVTIPAADARYLDIPTPEMRIEPGEEKMFCYHVTWDGEEDIAVSYLQGLQGSYGHHLVLLTTTDPKPSGTMEDCSDNADMGKYRTFVLPGNPLPEAHGILVPKGMHFVVQSHYMNAGRVPLLARDVARLEKIALEDVATWTTTLTTNSFAIELPPGEQVVKTFDCTIDEDVELLLVGGHMHEEGSEFELQVGPDADSLHSVYRISWRPDYRDIPPVELFFTEPYPLPAGTLLRTTCSWDNSRAHTVTFPEEMCAVFGYIRGTQNAYHCEES